MAHLRGMREKIPLQTVPLGKKDPAWMAHFKAGEFKQGSKVLRFRIREPEVQDGQRYPLILWLHGVKGRGDDNQRQMTGGNSHAPAFFGDGEIQAKFPAYVLLPQCPGAKFWINFVNHRVRKPLKQAITLVEHLKETLPVDSQRIYVGGQSMGGFGTWAVLADYPQLFAAGIPVSGGGSVRKLKRNLQAPVWVFHGANDPIVRVSKSREMTDALKKAEKPVTYTEFPTGRHDIWPLVFAEPRFAEWLFACKTHPPKRKR